MIRVLVLGLHGVHGEAQLQQQETHRPHVGAHVQDRPVPWPAKGIGLAQHEEQDVGDDVCVQPAASRFQTVQDCACLQIHTMLHSWQVGGPLSQIEVAEDAVVEQGLHLPQTGPFKFDPEHLYHQRLLGIPPA